MPGEEIDVKAQIEKTLGHPIEDGDVVKNLRERFQKAHDDLSGPKNFEKDFKTFLTDKRTLVLAVNASRKWVDAKKDEEGYTKVMSSLDGIKTYEDLLRLSVHVSSTELFEQALSDKIDQWTKEKGKDEKRKEEIRPKIELIREYDSKTPLPKRPRFSNNLAYSVREIGRNASRGYQMLESNLKALFANIVLKIAKTQGFAQNVVRRSKLTRALIALPPRGRKGMTR